MLVTDRDGAYREILCVQEQRVAANDNTVSWNGRHLQIPESPLRRHFMVEGTFGVVGGDPGLRHERTYRHVVDSFLSRLVLPNAARNSYAAGSDCI